jgi:hypothetical protein
MALRDNAFAVAHVPLTQGDLRTRLYPQATATIFITRPDDPTPKDIGAVAANFGLTPAKARMAAGSTLREAADRLAISGNTAKTHVTRMAGRHDRHGDADVFAPC